ncbi:hypothetical protein ACFWBI_38465 [Streptomyces sp. NPDC059982]
MDAAAGAPPPPRRPRRAPLLDVRTAPTWPGCVLACQALPLNDRVRIGYA